jgi:two-component system sensor histidine kinase TctE
MDAMYYGQAVRVGSYARVLARPLAGRPAPQRVVIQVAETLGSRQAFTQTLVLQAVSRDILLVLAAGALLALAIGWALRPLERLRNEVQARPTQDMRPIATSGIPAEVRPLVEAINQHVERNRRQSELQRNFVDDASHQLRTPLATLATQVGFALREADPQRQHEALRAIKSQLDETVRQTNQMLALARADSALLQPQPLDAVAIARQVTGEWWSAARQHCVDLGFEAAAEPLIVAAQPALLKEALGNLLHNAVRYTPRGAQVTVRVGVADAQQVAIEVIDDGPGLADDELPRAGERFFRGRNARPGGTGIGLAIVRSIAERHGGRLRVARGPDGRGLQVALLLPHGDAARD